MSAINKANRNSAQIAAIFLVLGFLLLVASIFFELQIVALIGLGFTFWGAIFAVTRTGKFIESNLLDSTARSTYSTIDRMIKELNYTGKSYYFPAFPQNAYLPDYLKNLKDSVVFISDESFVGSPVVEEMVSGRFLSSRAKGVFITAPGSGLLSAIEKQLKLDFTKITLNDFCVIMPRCMTDHYNLAKTLELTIPENDVVKLRITGVLYESLYSSENNLQSVGVLGCPVVSAVACALAKSSGKTVVIQKQSFWLDGLGVEVMFNLLRG